MSHVIIMTMRRVLLITGIVLLVSGLFGAIIATVVMGQGAAITSQGLQQVSIVAVISSWIFIIGVVMVILAVVLRRDHSSSVTLDQADYRKLASEARRLCPLELHDGRDVATYQESVII